LTSIEFIWANAALSPLPFRLRPSRSENRKCRNSLSALAGIDVEKPYGQKAALIASAVHNNQLFRRCGTQATDSGRKATGC
jgi:hypothetical protein